MEHMDKQIWMVRNEIQKEKKSISGQENSLDEKQPIDIYKECIELNGVFLPMADKSLLEDQVKIRIPKNFMLMPTEIASLKYPSERRPNPIFTDESTSINLAFNYTTTPLADAEMQEFNENMVEVFKQMQPGASWLDEGIKDVHDKPMGFIEFISPALDGAIYNLMVFLSFEDQALICSFNCLEEDREEWRPIAHAMMESLQINTEEKGGVRP